MGSIVAHALEPDRNTSLKALARVRADVMRSPVTPNAPYSVSLRPRNDSRPHRQLPGTPFIDLERLTASHFNPVPQRRCRKRSQGENRTLSATSPIATITTMTPMT